MMAAAETGLGDIARVAHNLVTGYTATLAVEPLLGKVAALTDPLHSRFVAHVHNMRGRSVTMGPDGTMQVS